MKKHLSALVAAVAVIAVLTPLAATLSAAEVNCRIPFSFMINGKAMAPGAYSLETRDAVLLVRGIGSSSAVVLTNNTIDYSEHGAQLVFLKTGDRYDLAEVWTSDGHGRSLLTTKARRAIEERARAANLRVERTVITAIVDNR